MVINYTVGLKNFLYPVQSLRCFENSIYKFSIIESYIYFTCFRLLGALMLFGYISVFSVIFKRTIMTLFLSNILVIIPFIITNNRLILFFIPAPSSLFLGNQLLSEMQSNIKLASNNYSILMLIITVCILMTILLFVISSKMYSNSLFSFKKNIKKIKVISFIIIVSLLVCSFVGCNKIDDNLDNINVCLVQSSVYGETDKNIVNFDYLQQEIIVENKDTHDKINILREAICEKTIIEGIFVKEEWCYYLEKQIGKVGFRIYGVNLTNFKRKLVYNSMIENIEDYFGLITKNSENDIIKTMADYAGFYLNDQ